MGLEIGQFSNACLIMLQNCFSDCNFFHDDARQLISTMLEITPENRPSSSDVVLELTKIKKKQQVWLEV